jgi:hypothetical protein
MAKKLQDAEAKAEQLQCALDKEMAAKQFLSDASQTRANANWEDGETIVPVPSEQPMTTPKTRNAQSELSQDASGKVSIMYSSSVAAQVDIDVEALLLWADLCCS